MPRVLKILLAVVGAVVAIYALLAVAMYWQLRTRTDVADYDELIHDWKQEQVAHFPKAIPAAARNTKLSFFPGFLQGGAHLQVRMTLPASETLRIERDIAARSHHVYRGGGIFDHYNEDQAHNVATTSFHTADPKPRADFPLDYTLYVLGARDAGGGWNHGETSGIAISRSRSEVIYWAESW